MDFYRGITFWGRKINGEMIWIRIPTSVKPANEPIVKMITDLRILKII